MRSASFSTVLGILRSASASASMSSRSRPVTKVFTSSAVICSPIFFSLRRESARSSRFLAGAGRLEHLDDQADAGMGFLRGVFQQLIKPVGLSEEHLERKHGGNRVVKMCQKSIQFYHDRLITMTCRQRSRQLSRQN